MPTLIAKLLGGGEAIQPPRLGRPPRIAGEATPVEQAERNAAWLAAFTLKEWRDRHCRERVPGSEKEKIIGVAIEEASKAFRVPAHTIKASNIRILLKNRQIVVP
jgi:hypothetical protein